MATFDSAHPIPDSVRNGPLGFNVLLREMRSLKTSMYLLMDHLAQIRVENRTLSSDVQKLMKKQDFNFEDIRSELIDFKKSLGLERFEDEVAPSEDTVLPDSEQLPSNSSDTVDVTTIMRNGSAEPPKREIIQVGPDVRVKQEEEEEEEAHDQPPMITDGLVLEPVASTSAEQYTSSSVMKSHIQQHGSRPTGPVVRVSTEKRTIPWMETEEYETWANDLKRRKMDSLSRGLPNNRSQNLIRFAYCYICRTTILSSKCVVPTNPQKFDIFLQCAAKTMTQAAIYSFKERKPNTKVRYVCESHVPGYKNAIKEIPNPNHFPGLGDEICEDAEEKTIVQQRRDNFVKAAPRLITKFPADNKKGASK